MPVTDPPFQARAISKRFGATLALDGINFDVQLGELHALVGENGAGKSTLVRILSGVHRPDRGDILLDGMLCDFKNPRDAIAAGILTIPQELRLVPSLSVAENLALGDPPVRRGLPRLNRTRMREEARRRLVQLDFEPDPDIRLDRLSFAERQLVAIAKALQRRCRLLILDEPTAALQTHEIDRLFAVLARMKSEGTSIVYVSHRLDEVVALGDRCTVLRDGRVAATSRRGTFKVADLVKAMTGRAIAQAEGDTLVEGEVILEDADNRPDSMRLHAKEVLGLAGLLGSGSANVLRRLFGIGSTPSTVRRNGALQRFAIPRAAVSLGIGFVPDERRLSLFMNLSVRDNILLPSLNGLKRGMRIDRERCDRLVGQLMEELDIRPRQPNLRVAALSGGNQQKVVLAKWLARAVGVLLLDEPTQGVDIAAKAQIHALIRDFARRGGGVMVRSSELPELALLCDSIQALHRGRVTERVRRAEGFDEKRLHTAMGG